MSKKVRRSIQTPKKKSTLSLLKTISGESKDIPIMSTKLEPIRYVPTIFTSFNRAIVLGGAPLRSHWLIHGPPGGGKTALALGIINSFTRFGHAAAFIDAEHAVSKQWFTELGADMDSILFKQPNSFEETTVLVDKWISNFKEAKEKGKIENDRGFVIVIDTIHKLVPEKELSQLTGKNADKNLYKGWGRYRANLISVWIDKLTPVIGKNDVAFITIAHEREENSEGKNWYSPDYKVKGGQTLLFEAAVRIRVTAGEQVTEVQGKKKVNVGRTHHFTVEKNKVGFPHESGTFYTSNGKGSAPIGFDLARESFVEGVRREIIIRSGSWYELPDGYHVQGEKQAIEHIREDNNSFNNLCKKLTIQSMYQCTD
jgi:recombination protein RecA